MKKTLNILFKSLGAVVVLFGLFYIFLVIPNDSRINMPDFDSDRIGNRHLLIYDLIKMLPKADILSPNIESANKALLKYPYKQNSPYLHSHEMNLHLSLGWFPLKTHHEDCIFAPDTTQIEYNLLLPDKPVLKFNYGTISSINRQLCDPMRFSVIVIDKDNQEHKIFEKNEFSFYPFKYESTDRYYKDFYKYFYPGMKDRDGAWNFENISLEDFAGQKVKIKFITKKISMNRNLYNMDEIEKSNPDRCFTMPLRDAGDIFKRGGCQGLAFWGQPAVYNKVSNIDKPNVILIVIDSLRGDCISKGYTPNLYRYKEESVDFTKALSNGNMTKLSVPSFLMSRYPTEIAEISMHYDVTKIEREKFYSRKLETLPSVLKKNGYRTAAIGSCSLFCDGHGFSADLGFDEVINLEHSGYSPPHVTMTGIDWLKKHGQEKYFLMLYYDGPHGPYRPPLRYLWASMKQGHVLSNVRKMLYMGDVAYHDKYIGYLREFLESSGLDKKTVIVFTADHGVTFRSLVFDWPTKFGAWKKKRMTFHSHGVSLTPDDINVPLMFYAAKPPRKIDTYVQLLDLAPTILDLTGSKIPQGFKGKSLLSSFDSGKFGGHLVSFHQGWQNRGVYWKGRWLYINNFKERDGFPKESVVPEELYDLKEDIMCLKNLALIHPWSLSVTSKTRGLLRNFIPDNSENKLLFIGKKNSKAVVSIKFEQIEEGLLYDMKTSGKMLKKTGNMFSVELSNGQDIVFNTNNPGQTFTLNCFVDKIILKKQEVLAGEMALPVLQSLALDQRSLELISGWPEESIISKIYTLPKVILGTVSDKMQAKENIGNSSAQLKSMLEQWGYINQ